MAEPGQDDWDGQDHEHQDGDDVPNNEENAQMGDEDDESLMAYLTDPGFWWSTIVHRAVEVDEGEAPVYSPDTWTDQPKDAPFPFNLDETWYCAALLALVLCVHCELDRSWLLRNGYLHYFMRVLFKTSMTVAISIFSTFTFETLGNVFQIFIIDFFPELIKLRIDALFVERWGWGPVGDDGAAIEDANGDLEFYRDTTYLREPLRKAITGMIMLIYQWLFIHTSSLLYSTGTGVPNWLLVKLAGLASNKNMADLVFSITSIFALPTPSIGEETSLITLLWEFGGPASVQIAIAAFLYSCVFLYMAKAETPTILWGEHHDNYCRLVFHLLRAISMHLLAYTAYQIACICVVGTQAWPFFGMAFDYSNANPLVAQRNDQFFIGSSVLLLITHYIIKTILKLLIHLGWSFWSNYIVWLSIKTKVGIQANWHFYQIIMNEDMQIFNPGNRVVSRVMMTALFGLKSSWPARMRLSSLARVD
ncbi:hypothetical protein F4779DRAFT_596375 [Xylariaceae sp. FL0662B]|nr:hypothetical protein F4779DRAFT_596375 [Xylariaceae sp. FL0662B]